MVCRPESKVSARGAEAGTEFCARLSVSVSRTGFELTGSSTLIDGSAGDDKKLGITERGREAGSGAIEDGRTALLAGIRGLKLGTLRRGRGGDVRGRVLGRKSLAGCVLGNGAGIGVGKTLCSGSGGAQLPANSRQEGEFVDGRKSP
jgi:hypothetical protein